MCAETSERSEKRHVAAMRSDLDEEGITRERQCKEIAILFCFE